VDDQARSGELTCALVGLGEYTVTAAVEMAEGGLVVEVIATRAEAPCPACGTFSDRVKSYRTCTVRDSPTHGRRCRLLVTKRAFRCVTPGCARKSFTETSGQVPASGEGHDPLPTADRCGRPGPVDRLGGGRGRGVLAHGLGGNRCAGCPLCGWAVGAHTAAVGDRRDPLVVAAAVADRPRRSGLR